MTTYTLEGKTQYLSIAEKAKLLAVSEIAGFSGILAVSSGSRKNFSYQVRHNGKHAVSCNCDSRVKCSHMVAADEHLAPSHCISCGHELKSSVGICGSCCGY